MRVRGARRKGGGGGSRRGVLEGGRQCNFRDVVVADDAIQRKPCSSLEKPLSVSTTCDDAVANRLGSRGRGRRVVVPLTQFQRLDSDATRPNTLTECAGPLDSRRRSREPATRALEKPPPRLLRTNAARKEGHPQRIPGERSVTGGLFPERISESHVCPLGTRYAEDTAADAAIRRCVDGTEDIDEQHETAVSSCSTPKRQQEIAARTILELTGPAPYHLEDVDAYSSASLIFANSSNMPSVPSHLLPVLAAVMLLVPSSAAQRNPLARFLWRPRISFPLDPTSPTVSAVSVEVLDEAAMEAHRIIIKQKAIEKSHAAKGLRVSPLPVCPASARHMQTRVAKDKAIAMDEMAHLFEETTRLLSHKMKMFWEDEFHGLARTNLAGSRLQLVRERCQQLSNHVCRPGPFRELDGSCNNLEHPDWGAAFSCMRRLLPPRYADGVSSPRISETGAELPNPRMVSTTVHVDLDRPSRDTTHMLMQWGQFLDHDFALAPISSVPGEIVDLGNPNDVIDCCFDGDAPLSSLFLVRHPADGPLLRQVRRALHELPPLGQVPAVQPRPTATDGLSDIIRRRVPGRLKFDVGRRGDMILPASFHPTEDKCSRPELGGPVLPCGRRARERAARPDRPCTPLWLRQHNLIAMRLSRINPHWDDERIYQEARRIVIGQMQMITYNEFLPLVVGKAFHREFGLEVLPYGYTTYNSQIDPSMLNEFAGAAFRFGHTILNGDFMQIDSRGRIARIALQEHFFRPFEFRDGLMERVIRGLARQSSQRFDNFITDDVTNHLYRTEQRVVRPGPHLPQHPARQGPRNPRLHRLPQGLLRAPRH
ncbi:hypothetical protein MRX96_042684 [Rhipicephalus microplus]